MTIAAESESVNARQIIDSFAEWFFIGARTHRYTKKRTPSAVAANIVDLLPSGHKIAKQ